MVTGFGCPRIGRRGNVGSECAVQERGLLGCSGIHTYIYTYPCLVEALYTDAGLVLA